MFRVVIGDLLLILAINSIQPSSQFNTTPSFNQDTINFATHDSNVKIDNDNRTKYFHSNEDIEKSKMENIFTNAESKDQCFSNVFFMTDGKACIPLCCPYGNRMTNEKCIETNNTYSFPPLYNSNNLTLIDEIPDYRRYFHLSVKDPCKGWQRYKLSPKEYPEDEFMILDNGSVYKYNKNELLRETDYCLGILLSSVFDIIVCYKDGDEYEINVNEVLYPIGMIVSVPFLFATFIVYCLLPELKNLHGYTLRAHIISLLVAYTTLSSVNVIPQKQISNSLCIIFAFVIHFSFLASFFWLNVMCFDIWWTFGGFRSLHGSVKQRERKKFLIYSIYAWGCAAILTGICAIMDFLPKIPNYLIKPDFGKMNCWFTRDEAKAIYFYGPMGITVLCNICLFISTALKIRQHGKDTAQHLRGIDSRRHDDNKQWFNLYLKLFIVMGINWSMEIISWLCNNTPIYLWYLTDFTNTLQGVIIFIIFVWKDKVKRLLLKRFGCHGSNVFSRNSTRSGCRTCTSTTSAPSFQEKIVTYSNESFCDKTIVDN